MACRPAILHTFYAHVGAAIPLACTVCSIHLFLLLVSEKKTMFSLKLLTISWNFLSEVGPAFSRVHSLLLKYTTVGGDGIYFIILNL